MTKRVQLVRHDNAGSQSFLGKLGELTVNTGNESVIVHNGINQGGQEQARADLVNVVTASALTAGKMSAQQAADLAQALLDIATNLANISSNDVDIATNVADIATNVLAIATNAADIATNATAIATKAARKIPATATNVATLDAAGDLGDGGATLAEIRARSSHTGTQLLATISDSGALAALNTVSQAEIDASAVGQGELKSTSGTVSVSGVNQASAILTLAGGAYGFYPRVWVSGGVGDATIASKYGFITGITNTSALTRIMLVADSESSGNIYTAYASQQYIQASPPYNLGDGDIPLFIFATVDNSTGKIESLYVASEAPWHYNGKTDIRATRKDTVSGRSWRLCSRLVAEKLVGNISNNIMFDAALTMKQKLDIINDKDLYEVEITQDIKQRDMVDVPHPFSGNDLTGKTIIMLDPVSDLTTTLADLHTSGENINQLLHEEYITFGNSQIARATPNECMCVHAAWKNTL